MTARGEDAARNAPAALRAAGLVERLCARDAGEARTRIRDKRRDPDTGVVGAAEVRRASLAIASHVREVLEARECPLVVGGDCTLLLGVFEALPRRSGLWFVDGHADFFDGESSPSGEAADMDLAILTGHGPPGLLERDGPLLEPDAVVLLGHRPAELHLDVARENARLDPAIHALTAPEVRERGAGRVGTDAAARLAERPAWLHLDLDVLDEGVLPAVSYPQPLGLDWGELLALMRPLADVLETSAAAVNSALQRARATMKQHLPERRSEWASDTDATAAERELLARYVEYGETPDPLALKQLFREDVRFSMPPQPGIWEGRDEVVQAWIDGGFGSESFGSLRCVLARANRQPAVACYVRKPGDEGYSPLAIDVLRIVDGAVADIVTFDGSVFSWFGLPETL